MQVGELFVALGFSVDDAKLKEFNDRIGAGTKAIGAMAAGAAAAVYGVNRFINSAVNQSVQLTNLNKILGASTEEIKRLEVAGQQFNAAFSLDDAIGTWTKLYELIQESKLGNMDPNMLWLGIGDIRDDNPIDIINKLRESRTRATDRDQWAGFVRNLGFENLIPLLESSNSDFGSAMSIPVPSASDIAAWNEVADAMNRFKREYDNAKLGLSGDFSPSLIEWLENSRAAVSWLSSALGTMTTKFRESWDSVKMFIYYLGFVLAGIVALFFPLTWIPIGVAAILTAWNTLGESIRGNSWINTMLDGLNAIPEAIKNALGWFTQLGEKVSGLAEKFKDSMLLKFLNLFVTEQNSVRGKLKQSLEDAGIGKATGIIQDGGMGRPFSERYDPRGFPPMPFPIAPMEQNVTIAPQYTISTTANPRDMWDSLSAHEQTLMRNTMLDGLYGVSGNQAGGNGL